MRKRMMTGFTVLALGVIVLLMMNICIGSVNVPVSEIVKSINGSQKNELYADIILHIRLPRALAAMLLGGALALSGYLLQTFFRNPIAGPFVLGISAGAKLFVALTMVGLLRVGYKTNSLSMIVAAFLGAIVSMGFVLLIAKVVDRMSLLIVSGVMISYICSAITEIVVTFADDSNIVNLHNWSLGSFSGTSWENVLCIGVVMGSASIGTFLLAKPMGAYELGEGYARNLGVNVEAFRILLVLLSSILAACVTAFAGPISFVGVAVPHLIKRGFQTAKPIYIIPGSILGGGLFCLLCDLLARILFAPTELSVSTMTAVFGAPVVIWIMLHNKARM